MAAESTSCASSSSLPASSPLSRFSELTRRRRSRRRPATWVWTFARSRWVGSNSRNDLAQVAAASLEPAARAVDQQAQVVARVGIERGQELVRVHVGQRVAQGHVPPSRTGRPRPGSTSRNMSLSGGLGPQQGSGVLADQPLVLAVDQHLHDRVAVLQVHRSDLADLHAGHAHGLPCARHHRLSCGQLGLEAHAAPPRAPGSAAAGGRGCSRRWRARWRASPPRQARPRPLRRKAFLSSVIAAAPSADLVRRPELLLEPLHLELLRTQSTALSRAFSCAAPLRRGGVRQAPRHLRLARARRRCAGPAAPASRTPRRRQRRAPPGLGGLVPRIGRYAWANGRGRSDRAVPARW